MATERISTITLKTLSQTPNREAFQIAIIQSIYATYVELLENYLLGLERIKS